MRIQKLHKTILWPFDCLNGEENCEKKANVFAKLIQLLRLKSVSYERSSWSWQKLTANFERALFIKRKTENNFLVYWIFLCKASGESITDYIRAENATLLSNFLERNPHWEEKSQTEPSQNPTNNMWDKSSTKIPDNRYPSWLQKIPKYLKGYIVKNLDNVVNLTIDYCCLVKVIDQFY